VGWGIAPVAHADADSTAELRAKLDALKPGDTLTLTGRYSHSGVLVIRVPNVTIDGNGATLNATSDPTSSVQIKADGVTVKNLNLTAPSDGPRYSAPSRTRSSSPATTPRSATSRSPGRRQPESSCSARATFSSTGSLYEARGRTEST
jgi:hypothetical protein